MPGRLERRTVMPSTATPELEIPMDHLTQLLLAIAVLIVLEVAAVQLR
jgi:hypothetical protein